MTIRAFLGGSFDPVHSSHLSMAMRVHATLSQAATDPISVSLMPTKGNPFKGKPTPDEHRLAMLRLATTGTPIGIETCELDRTPPIYTIDTLRHLQAMHKDAMLIFIMGKDSLSTLPRWKHSDDLLMMTKFWVFDRINDGTLDDMNIEPVLLTQCTDDLAVFLQTDKAIFMDHTPIMALSSSQLRQRIQMGVTVDGQLPSTVAQYISTHKLYQKPSTVL
ncbi:nicotinate (nicotinamide) nucleotide adenylyltransferase [Moraxella sp.]|uniref:nicotinate (nicotinamide) nucleotide adenylyltransferase n=1 Tax=Moraxella sp. TaxID=479 RepID=UPI0026DD15A4|nr:nicotinate (nicotinamide) nucleotide adenylyltransferase [Moraxella sp.]MDO4894639.1 nicotinate (nicotinamide) nucleotide adenylyltransferase [Moraxella sp.]